MKNKIGTQLISIKENKKIVEVLKNNRKINLPFISLFLSKNKNLSTIEYALLVNKSQFKLSVTRNKIKRQLRNILIDSEFGGGFKILFKPNSLYLKKQYQEVKQSIYKSLNKNGK